jgi:hypothetical protein
VRRRVADEPREFFFDVRLQQHRELAKLLGDFRIAANRHIAALNDFLGVSAGQRRQVHQTTGNFRVRIPGRASGAAQADRGAERLAIEHPSQSPGFDPRGLAL